VVACNTSSWSTDAFPPFAPYASLYTTLGDPPWFPLTDLDPRTARHNREGLPMAFADGHGEFVRAEVIKTYPWAMGSNHGLMDVSFGYLDYEGAYGWAP
jgi:hypothetical protein